MTRARDNANLSPTIPDARMPNLTGAITTVEGAVATTIANDAVDSQHYAAGSIDNEHLADDAVGTDELANDVVINTSGAITTTGTATFSGDIVPSTPLSHRNMIINGAMQVAQRGTSVTGVGIDDYGSPDRYRNISYSGAEAGRLTSTQTTITDLAGFTKGQKLQVTTADTSVAATDMSQMSQRIEQQDIEHIGVGTAGAKAFTFSFYARANAAITLCAGVGMGGTSGAFFTEKAITTSWQRFEVNMPATTVSSHKSTISSAVGVGMEVFIMLYAGSNLNTGTNSTWAAPANYVGRCNTNQGNFYSSTSNWLETTGWQLELGSSATPFEHRSYGDEIERCKRYFQVIEKAIYGPCVNTSTGAVNWKLDLSPEMRATPTMSLHHQDTSATATAIRYGDMIATGVQMSSVTTSVNYYSTNKYLVFTTSGTKDSGSPTLDRTQLLEPSVGTDGRFFIKAEL